MRAPALQLKRLQGNNTVGNNPHEREERCHKGFSVQRLTNSRSFVRAKSTAKVVLCIMAAIVGVLLVPLLIEHQRPLRVYLLQSDDPRVQNRTYLFADTNEQLPYSLFVSSKVSPGRKNPLIVTLHGLSVGPGFMVRGTAVDLAEEGGYILVGPLGYHAGGWYGTPLPLWMRNQSSVGRAQLRELGEKDVMNVVDIMRNEFNVDENRIYLMGHSMGGAGAYQIGMKYVGTWAAIAAVAPATYRLAPDMLEPVKATLPVMVVQGNADGLVSVQTTRRWVDWMAENGMTYEYLELPGVDHSAVMEAGISHVFEFFAQHSKGPTCSTPIACAAHGGGR